MKNLLFTILFFLSTSLLAREPSQLPIPDDLANTKIYLLTVGLGPGIEARYGHTMVRIVYPDQQEENLNWGMFSFEAPNFALNFFLGKLIYSVASESYRNILHRYQHWEHRRLFSNQLNLTSSQKRKFLEAINGFFREQGTHYPYQYFYNNCSTIPRDLLDAALEGRLKAWASAQSSGVSFRWYVYTYLNAPPPVAFFLDILMNSRIDFVINRWQEMFFPLKLQEHVQAFVQFDSEAEVPAGASLLGPTEKLNHFEDVPAAAWHFYPWFLLCSLLLLAPFVLDRIGPRPLFSLPKRKIVAKAAGFYLLLWGFFAGLLGTVMLVSWIFSEHLDLHHNANLWLLWPWDFLYVVPGAALLWGARVGQRSLGWYRSLAVLHLAALLGASLLFMSGIIVQDISRVLIYLGPGIVLANIALSTLKNKLDF
jgi:hypothetical protein